MANQNTVQLANNVLDAKVQYKEALKLLSDAIIANKKAMHAFRATPSAQNKTTYDGTRAAHKAAIAHIKAVRSNYYKQLDSQTTVA